MMPGNAPLFRIKESRLPIILYCIILIILVSCNGMMWPGISDRSENLENTQYPSPTSFPILPQDDSRSRVIELLQTNGGCRLPCWWGIIPGQTRWEDVHALLSPLLKISIGREEILSYGDRIGIGTREEPMLPGLEIMFQDSIVQDILAGSVSGNFLSSLNISQIFRDYGKPDEVYIRTFSFSKNIPFEIFLYYPRQGIAIKYLYYVAEGGEIVQLCNLDQPRSADFFVWEPVSSNIQDIHPIEENSMWHPLAYKIIHLEAASEWTVDFFYTAFQLPGIHSACLETPLYLWTENR